MTKTTTPTETFRTSLAEHLLLAAIAYIPLLVVKPGVVTSDTKTYLYLDPGRFLRQVASMWDPSVALGTVTHEYIGYLLPMGPFYWFFSVAGVPVWVAQRLWLGSVIFAAGAGLLLLCRTVDVRSPGRTVGALAFMISPYLLQYSGRISVILLPWAGLPFMVAFAARALRKGGWRYPALFALTVAVTSGINASSIIYVAVAPALWLVFAVAAGREGTWRQAGEAALKMVVLTFLCCLWWITGLVVEAGYGVDVLRYTETLTATSETSSASEVIRGLGYWYFYGADRLGPWAQSAVMYTQQLWLLSVSFLVPVLAFLAAVIVRWRYRAYFVALVVVGVVLSVGPHPYTNPTPVGGLLKQFMSDTTAGLALRSTDRATPLVILGLAVLLAAGISAIRMRLPMLGYACALLAAAAVVAANPAIFNGDAEVVSFFTQPAKLPSYETAAIAHLNATHKSTRVLAIPGDNFASYRWGDTVDTPQPAFLDRPFVTREQQVMGSIATADTLFALDDPIQSGTEQWDSLAPMARLLSAGDVLVEYDQRYEHYGVPQPQLLAQQLQQTPAGLSDPVSFGKPAPNISSYSTLDGQDLASLQPLAWPSPLVDFTVQDPRAVTRAESDSGALVVAGDATGLQDLADAGLLDTDSAIYYSSSLDTDPGQLHQLVAAGGQLVVTDTNRKQAFRWDTVSANYGETETPSEDPERTDPSDSPIDLSPAAPSDSRTTASYVGAVDVTASSYGDAVSYTPEDRPDNAIDANLDTSWNTGTFVPDPAGQWWQAHFQNAVSADHVTLVQPQSGNTSRWITRITLTFDGGHKFTAGLGPSSRSAQGQVVSFPARTFHSLRITIDATSDDHRSTFNATSVGFAEVEVPGQHVVEVIQMPRDLLQSTGASSLRNRLTIVMTRQRVSPYSFPYRADPETTISRGFSLPTARTFTIAGSASLSALVPDDEIDRLVGRSGSDGSGVVAYSKGRLPGDLRAGASAAADGDLGTAWQPGFGAAYEKGEWLEYNLPDSTSFDHLDLQVVADGRHSVPTSITVSTENGSRSVALPHITDTRTPGATTSVPVTFSPLSGSQIRITITGVRLERSTNFDSPTPIALPMAIAEVGIPGVQVAPVPAQLPGDCVSNLVSIDGRPVSVSIRGSTSTALDDGEVSVVPCGADAGGVTLGPGQHVVETALGHTTSTGWNIDQLLLDSASGDGPAPAATFGATPATQPGAAPTVAVTHKSTTSETLRVSGAVAPFELVFGQSNNSGWRAVATSAGSSTTTQRDTAGGAGGGREGSGTGRGGGRGRAGIDLGNPQLVDAFANGWQVTASDLKKLGMDQGGATSFTVSLSWSPQQRVWVGLGLSAAAIVACVALAVLPVRLRLRLRRRRPARPAPKRPERSTRRRAEPLLSAASAALSVALEARRMLLRLRGAGPAPAAVSPVPAATGTIESPPGPALASWGEPVLSMPLSGGGRRPRVWAVVTLSILAGLAASAIVSPLVGGEAAAATAAALSLRWLRGVLTLAAVGLLVAAAVSIVAGQALHFVPESSNWPSAYESASLLVWMAVVALGADAVADTARSWRDRSTVQPDRRAGGRQGD
ncbi:MAG TPA: alpha-(1-_3)-arabinofuranosyltransferase family protein [Acidimicrobiales bacterium]|nr:alpha-(1->3)-arabinofuranosyltransferase family protein [Acidimicrobiales bacterium]